MASVDACSNKSLLKALGDDARRQRTGRRVAHNHPHRAAARTWLEGALAAAQTCAIFTVMPMVLARVLHGGNELPDAWLAAAVDHQGEHLVSFDCDFRKVLGRARLTLLEA